MKQSSIEWFYQQLVDRQNGHGDSRSIDEILEQAKAMHKSELESIWLDSRIEDKGDAYIGKEKTFQEYYKDKFA